MQRNLSIRTFYEGVIFYTELITMTLTSVFIHGLESTSHGTKGEFFRNKYPDMILEDFVGPLDRRMDKLDRLLQEKTDLVLVGSSYGGLMAAIYACRNPRTVRKLTLLAPALNLIEFEPYLACRIEIPVTLYHGRFDEVVPLEAVQAISREVFSNLDYHAVDDDHSLHHTFSGMAWEDLLHI
jgi:pimeloyl-ACP methyl ester carboxylesterase